MRITVLVDFQNDFVDKALGFPGAEKLDAPIAARLRENFANGDYFVQTNDTHGTDYMNTREGKNLPIMHCGYGTHGWKTYGVTNDVIEDIIMKDRCYVINKPSFGVSPSRMIDFMDWLRDNGIKAEDVTEIEFMGLVSNICVISNIVTFQSAFPNATMVINPALTASFDPVAHEACLTVMKGLQVKFID